MNIRSGGLPRTTAAFIDQRVAAEGMVIKKILRVGKRFFVADVRFQGKRALFKTCVYPKSSDPWTNKKFGREILFLQFLAGSRHHAARAFAPRIYRGSTQTRAWYVREYINGTVYNINGGNIRFRPSFFTRANALAILRGFRDLQGIKKGELPKTLRSRLKRHDQMKTIRALLDPNWKHIARYLHDTRATRDLPAILDSRQRIFDHTPAVLTHQEPYASHFIKNSGTLRLIDWENIAWANPVHDFTNLWMRSSDHPSWQNMLKRAAQRDTRRALDAHFEDVWETSIFIKALFNVLSFPSYPKKTDFRSLHALSQHIVREELRLWRTTHQ